MQVEPLTVTCEQAKGRSKFVTMINPEPPFTIEYEILDLQQVELIDLLSLGSLQIYGEETSLKNPAISLVRSFSEVYERDEYNSGLLPQDFEFIHPLSLEVEYDEVLNEPFMVPP